VVPLNWPLQAPPPQDMRWLRVEDASAVPACRQAVQVLAERLQFSAARIGQLALAVTEAASNLYKHAVQGSLLLCVNRDGPEPGIDLVTIDAGPGLRDVGAAVRDGHSTAGTLGIGLGAIKRLADFSDLYSLAGRGTSLVARFSAQPAGGATPPDPPALGGAARPPGPPWADITATAARPKKTAWLSTCAPATSTWSSSGLAAHSRTARSCHAGRSRVIQYSSSAVPAKAARLARPSTNTVSRTEVPPASEASAWIAVASGP
jgi:anti-sigma regulatory factor (Ser/Thr protein kinase)